MGPLHPHTPFLKVQSFLTSIIFLRILVPRINIFWTLQMLSVTVKLAGCVGLTEKAIIFTKTCTVCSKSHFMQKTGNILNIFSAVPMLTIIIGRYKFSPNLRIINLSSHQLLTHMLFTHLKQKVRLAYDAKSLSQTTSGL